jgi:hypothetical protein
MEKHELDCCGSGKGQMAGVSACCIISLGSVKCGGGDFLIICGPVYFSRRTLFQGRSYAAPQCSVR